MKHRPQRKKGKPRGTAGRKPTGRRGELVSEYKQVTVRLPPETVDTLVAIAARQDRTQWQVIADAIEAYDRFSR
jgi:hypothetical protein